MIHRVGFACVTYSLGLSTSHTFRLANMSEKKLRDAVDRNLRELEAILAWMEEKGLRLFRIGSSFIPFASHPRMTLDWKTMYAPRLAAIGREYASRGFRFSMHPGQYAVLNSPKPEVVERSLAEVRYACDLLDLMQLDESHKVVLHGGGVYGDKRSGVERLEGVLKSAPGALRRRLAIENDDRHYNFADIAGVSIRTGIPAVFDLQHHTLNPCGDVRRLLEDSAQVWMRRPKAHLSSQKPGARPGAHDLMVKREDLETLLDLLPFDADLMVEAKAKEAAALEVLHWLEADGRIISGRA